MHLIFIEALGNMAAWCSIIRQLSHSAFQLISLKQEAPAIPEKPTRKESAKSNV